MVLSWFYKLLCLCFIYKLATCLNNEQTAFEPYRWQEKTDLVIKGIEKPAAGDTLYLFNSRTHVPRNRNNLNCKIAQCFNLNDISIGYTETGFS